jgi:putative ABC transport system permease protein
MRLMADFKRLLRLPNRDVRRDVEDELQSHIEMKAAELVEAGLDPDTAHSEAQRRFGNLRSIRRRCNGIQSQHARNTARGEFMDALLRDVRFGFRTLRRNPGFTAVAVLTLGLGIGATTAIFSVVDAVILRPLALPNPDRVVQIRDDYPEFGLMGTSPATYRDYRDNNVVFQQFAGVNWWMRYLETETTVETVYTSSVTPDLLPLLGIEPLLGRGFVPEDLDDPTPLAILTYDFWLRHFDRDPNVIGDLLRLKSWRGSETASTVVGILPPEFRLPPLQSRSRYGPNPEPVALTLLRPTGTNRGPGPIAMLGRLKDNTTLQQAQANMDGIAAGIAAAFPGKNGGYTTKLVPLPSFASQNYGAALYLLWAASGLVLLIACVNVANLLLARGATRGRELAVRSSLGAGRSRLFRQLLAESLVLGALGGLAGLPLAFWGTRALVNLVPGEVYRLDSASVDMRALVFLSAASTFVAIVFGLLPATKGSRSDISTFLKAGTHGARTFRLGVLRVLVVSEVALALALVTGGGLLVRTYRNLTSVDLGFNPDNLLLFSFGNSPFDKRGEQLNVFRGQVEDRIRTLPGVAAVGWGCAPLGGGVPLTGFDYTLADRAAPPPEERLTVEEVWAWPGCIETMGIRVLAGRTFARDDVELLGRAQSRLSGIRSRPETASRPEELRRHRREFTLPVIINETMAQRYWADANAAIGKGLYRGTMDPQTVDEGAYETGEWDRNWPIPYLNSIVGVVSDVKSMGLDQEPHPQIYRIVNGAEMLVRTRSDPLALIGAIRHEIEALDPTENVASFETMKQRVSDAAVQQRFRMSLIGSSAAMALLLAAVGLFGVMAYAVGQRTHEIGIRMSLGARQEDIVKLVGRQGVQLIVVGSAVGLGGAFGLTRFMESFLFGVTPLDPLSFAAGGVLLGIVALLACYVPMRRASRVDPMVALRSE